MVNPVNFAILLNQVNNIRMALAIGEGKLAELPKGKKGDSDLCVLARALSNGWKADVHTYGIEFINDDTTIDLEKSAKALRQFGFKGVKATTYRSIEMTTTKTMTNFIERFDDGDFPWLVLEKEG